MPGDPRSRCPRTVRATVPVPVLGACSDDPHERAQPPRCGPARPESAIVGRSGEPFSLPRPAAVVSFRYVSGAAGGPRHGRERGARLEPRSSFARFVGGNRVGAHVMDNSLYLLLSIALFVVLNYLAGTLLRRPLGRVETAMTSGNAQLEVARGLLCFFVFVGHSVLSYNSVCLGSDFWPPADRFRTLNYLAAVGIDGFFFITGFLFASRLEARPDTRDFFAKRAARLVPAFVLVTAALVAIKGVLWGQRAHLLEGFYVWATPWLNYSIDQDHLVYGHYWSLRAEWFYYFVVAAIAVTFAARHRILALAGALLVFTAALDRTFSMMFAGVLAAYAARIPIVNRVFSRPSTKWLALAAFGLYLYAAPFRSYPDYVRFSLRWLAILFTGSSLVCGTSSRRSPSALVRALALSGLPAYSLYLTHGAVLYFIPTGFRSACGSSGDRLNATFAFSLIPVWVAAAWVAFLLSEYPYYLWRDRLKKASARTPQIPAAHSRSGQAA